MIFSIAILLAHLGALILTGTWKRWKEYYPTVLFSVVGDFSYNMLFSERYLWSYHTWFDHRIADIITAFFVFSCTVMLFLRYYPKGLLKEGLYIVLWTIVYAIIESISVQIGGIIHAGGWNMVWSAGLYFCAFILIRIHYKHPLIVWPIGLCAAIAMMFIFQQPFHFSAMP